MTIEKPVFFRRDGTQDFAIHNINFSSARPYLLKRGGNTPRATFERKTVRKKIHGKAINLPLTNIHDCDSSQPARWLSRIWHV